MMSCEDCKYWYDEDSLEGTGYCLLYGDYISAYGSCEDLEEE